MNLSNLCLTLGAFMVVSHGWALAMPDAASRWVRHFHRNYAAGVALMLAGAAWLEWNLYNENLQDIARMKPYLLALFPGIGIAACLWAVDFLAVRGLAAFLMMLAWYTLDVSRWHPSLWHDAIGAWAYVWVFSSFWLTLAPWRFRQAAAWLTDKPGRLRLAAVAGIAWGAFVAGLGLTALA